MTYYPVKNLVCPTCGASVETDGAAWVECAACGYRHGVFVKPQPDGTYSVKLRTGGRKPVTRKKMPVNVRVYDDDLQAIKARGYTVQRILDEGVARVLVLCECKLPGWAVDNPSVCPTCKKPHRLTEG